jgi:hypothetical protein
MNRIARLALGLLAGCSINEPAMRFQSMLRLRLFGLNP